MIEYEKLKRGLDVFFSATGLTLSLPVLAACAIAIKLDSPGPAVFQQQRLGRDGVPFTMYKIRSMTVGAESGGVYETANDTRVTTLGRILRKTSIDELPQLFNILNGSMSFIGPRPTLTYHPCTFDEYTEEQKQRFTVRPGITGLAQISGRKQLSWDKRLRLDVHYVKTMSLRQDFTILMQTVLQVARATGNINTGETAANQPINPPTQA